MATKVLISFIVAIVLSVVASAVLTETNYLVVRREDYSADAPSYTRVYIDEITMGGSVVQTWDPDCVVLDTNAASIRYDQNYGTASFACYKNSGEDVKQTADRLVVAIRPNGTLDYTIFSATSLEYEEPLSAFVSGRDVWIGRSGFNGVAYAKRNKEVVADSAVVVDSNQVIGIQIQDGVFYFGASGLAPYFVGTTAPGTIPRSASTPASSLFGSDLLTALSDAALTPTAFHVAGSVIYGGSPENVFKIYRDGNTWTHYASTFPYIGARGVTADPFMSGDTRELYFGSENKVVFAQDYQNQQFLSSLVFKTYSATTLVAGVVRIKSVPTCADATKNQDETDQDCGGYMCVACGNGKNCLEDADCTSNYCNPIGQCSVPTCSDTFSNQDETDVDCGGSCSVKCADDLGCVVNEDCTSSYCTPNGLCSTPSCTDTFKNQDETDADCGGKICSARCGISLTCTADEDCESGFCYLETCYPVSCTDVLKNGNETGVDCGGDCTVMFGYQCPVGEGCLSHLDCYDGYCKDNVCAAPLCTDEIRDGLETDVDCGGPACSGCGLGQGCMQASDCATDLWCSMTTALCINSTCSDTFMNQRETDVDCGGPNCSACADGKTCVENNDCASELCENKVCVGFDDTAPSTAPSTGPTGPVSTGSTIVFTVSSLLLGLVSLLCV